MLSSRTPLWAQRPRKDANFSAALSLCRFSVFNTPWETPQTSPGVVPVVGEMNMKEGSIMSQKRYSPEQMIVELPEIEGELAEGSIVP